MEMKRRLKASGLNMTKIAKAVGVKRGTVSCCRGIRPARHGRHPDGPGGLHRMIPPTARAQIDAICAREEVALRDLIGSHLAEQHLVAARHRIWAALRAEKDERGRHVYALQRIARWFGVAHSAVGQALRP